MKSEGVFEDGGTDCHSQCAHRFRNDREFYMGRGGRMNVGRGMKKERTVLSAPTGF